MSHHVRILHYTERLGFCVGNGISNNCNVKYNCQELKYFDYPILVMIGMLLLEVLGVTLGANLFGGMRDT